MVTLVLSLPGSIINWFYNCIINYANFNNFSTTRNVVYYDKLFLNIEQRYYCRTAIKGLLLYFNLCLSVMLDSLSCLFTSIFYFDLFTKRFLNWKFIYGAFEKIKVKMEVHDVQKFGVIWTLRNNLSV